MSETNSNLRQCAALPARHRPAAVRAAIAVLIAVGTAVTAMAPTAALAEVARHGIAMHGEPALPPGFRHFPYVRADAPKGGRLTLGLQGTFDSMNPFLPRGVPSLGIRGYVYESLLARADSEPFTLYGLIAESVEMPDDRSSITFNLHPKARFSDGKPITAEDVVYSHGVLKAHALPFMRAHYSKVAKAEIITPRRVRFTFRANGDREIPLILGLMPVLPKHALPEPAFKTTSLRAPIGSGPYTVSTVDAGRSITFLRDRNYWGRDLPTRRGFFNFDEIRIEYFRNDAALFTAFKTGAIDLRVEDDPARWSGSYNFPAVAQGRVIKEALPTKLPAGMLGIVLNTRRPALRDARVRRALIELFDFPWINQTLFNGLYARSQSFFARSDLAAVSQAASRDERALLAPFKSLVKADVLSGLWRAPQTDGTGRDRSALKAAYRLFTEAGYEIRNGQLVDADTGAPLAFTFLARTKAEERLMLAYQNSLKRLGIALAIRQVDDAQYWARLKTFDYDMIQWRYPSSLSPGNEQINRWASSSAGVDGSLNFAGVRNPGVDEMIKAMLRARSRADFEAAVRAFDRLLISGDYVIPLYHPPAVWVAYWRRLGRPQTLPLSGFAVDTWWARGAGSQSAQ